MGEMLGCLPHTPQKKRVISNEEKPTPACKIREKTTRTTKKTQI